MKIIKTISELKALEGSRLTYQTEWICTSCVWKGFYKETIPVMYHGIDWQNCPSCNAVAIPVPKEITCGCPEPHNKNHKCRGEC